MKLSCHLQLFVGGTSYVVVLVDMAYRYLLKNPPLIWLMMTLDPLCTVIFQWVNSLFELFIVCILKYVAVVAAVLYSFVFERHRWMYKEMALSWAYFNKSPLSLVKRQKFMSCELVVAVHMYVHILHHIMWSRDWIIFIPRDLVTQRIPSLRQNTSAYADEKPMVHLGLQRCGAER